MSYITWHEYDNAKMIVHSGFNPWLPKQITTTFDQMIDKTREKLLITLTRAYWHGICTVIYEYTTILDPEAVQILWKGQRLGKDYLIKRETITFSRYRFSSLFQPSLSFARITDTDKHREMASVLYVVFIYVFIGVSTGQVSV